jgi:predicted metal-dependent enzyme (double-stranded beta helix superfamily)
MESDCKSVPAFLAAMDALTEHTTDPQTCVTFVQQALTQLLQSPHCLAPAYTTPAAPSYARHLIYRHPHDRYVVVAMVWLPGQGTPIHDHGGVWCVEGVYQGHLRVTQYDLTPLDQHHVKAVPMRSLHAGLGNVGALIPPHEYHTITNTSQETAVTIHVYGANLQRCHVFVEDGTGLYTIQERELHYTSVVPQEMVSAQPLGVPRLR